MTEQQTDMNLKQYSMAEVKDFFLNELEHNILPFWLKYSLDQKNGGFYGRVDNKGRPPQEAPKSLILNTRILWSFSAAYSALGRNEYLKTADRAFEYICKYFMDREFGGAYWMLGFDGTPLDKSKKVYGHAFLLYALTEYYRATGNADVLDMAVETYHLIENRFYDHENMGYFEMYERDWSPAEDMRLSPSDMNEKKSMNAHLHMLEAYSSLLKVWPDSELRKRLIKITKVFRYYIMDTETSHFHLFFNELWEVKSDWISPGHDIEGSWLLWEAADRIEDTEIKDDLRFLSILQADAVYKKCLTPEGGVIYEMDSHGFINTEKHWWVQAEAMVGFLNAWQLSGDNRFYRAMLNVWNYIKNNLIDSEYGEWFYKTNSDNRAEHEFKISEWKGPYHNTRACLEIADRLNSLNEKDYK